MAQQKSRASQRSFIRHLPQIDTVYVFVNEEITINTNLTSKLMFRMIFRIVSSRAFSSTTRECALKSCDLAKAGKDQASFESYRGNGILPCPGSVGSKVTSGLITFNKSHNDNSKKGYVSKLKPALSLSIVRCDIQFKALITAFTSGESSSLIAIAFFSVAGSC